jgi:hypothetical protein
MQSDLRIIYRIQAAKPAKSILQCTITDFAGRANQ